MNIAVILAGGIGSRTEQVIPKQFLNVYDKPIIMYTLEAFQNHPEIDGIIVTCKEGWEEVLRVYAKQYKIDKLKWIVRGGENGQASARIAIEALEEVCTETDIIVIHDAVRPMLPADVITDCIKVCKKHGSGLAALRCQETIMKSKDGVNSNSGIDRNDIMRVQTPQAYLYGKAAWGHKEALRRGIVDAVYTNTIMYELGETLYFSNGSNKNIKITTAEDIEIFKALYVSKKATWMK